MPTLLIIDDDLAFIFWLGLGLEAAGIQSVPAKNATAARALLLRMENPPTVVVVNPGLAGATRLVRELRRRHSGLRVISAPVGGSAIVPALPGADAVMRKPDDYDDAARAEWIELIRRISDGETAKRAPQ